MPFRYVLLLLSFLLFGVTSRAQPYTLRGSVGDTLSKTQLHRASVVLVRSKDSLISGFTRTDSLGNFHLRVDSSGDYNILVTFPGYADYVERITINKDLSLRAISLNSRTHVLQEFVFKKKASAIMIKGDTTEYAADSFALHSGASVEELLKKLPGLQVDKDGKVTAQGEQVQKILVDGEEFFSDDPAVVTKNLQAATVDKVQVYDKKSDQAIFTGIEDGEKTKTINLTLKEDKKKGVFGKVVAGGGPSLSPDQKDAFFENQGMINLFRGKQQIAAFGIMSNTGTVGLGWNDRDKYSGNGGTREYDEESGMIYINNDDGGDDLSGSWSGKYSGEGMPTVWTGGLHYANKWNKDGQHLSANYRFGKNNIDAEGSTTTQYILPDSSYVRNQKRSTFSTATRHGGDGLYEWTIDTSSNLKLTVGGDYVDKATSGTYTDETRGASGKLINNGARITSTASASQSLHASLVYRKKFAKKGRNMSAEVNVNDKNTSGTGYLQSLNYYYTDTATATDNIDQRKTSRGDNFSINAKLSYTEPLSKVAFFTVRGGANVANSLSERFSFNRSGADWSPTADPVYSSSYVYDVLTQNAAASLRFVFKKYNFALGGEVFHTSWEQHDRLFNDSDRSRNYNNFSPTASLKYNFNKQANISFNYSGRTSQPTLEQLQPLRQNTDPLNISVGNPDLRQEFKNSIGLNYHSYKPLSGRYIYMSANGGFTKDAITRSENFDASGKHYYQYVNMNGNWNMWMWAGYEYKLKGPDMYIGANTNLSMSHANTIVNSQLNVSQNNEYGINLTIQKSWKKKDKDVGSFSLNPGFNYHDNQASITAYTTSYWSANINADVFAQLPWKVQFRSEAWYDLREQTSVFTANNNVIKWNASLGRKFLKGDKLELRASIQDILNQNIGYNRDAQANYLTEDRYNTIHRHALLSLTYLFSGGAGTVKNNNDDD